MGVHVYPGFGQAAIRFNCTGVTDQIVSTFGYKVGATRSDGPDGRANALLVALTDSTTKLFSPQQFSGEWAVQGVSVTENNDGVTEQGVSSGAPVIGQAISTSIPVNCAFLVRKGTPMAGRHGKGRMYLPPCFASEMAVTPGGLITGSLVSTQARLNLLLEDLATADLDMVLLHSNDLDPDTKQEIPGTALQPTLVTTLVMQPLIATQRRRLR